MEKGKNSTLFELKCGVLILISFKFGYPNVALYEVTTADIDELSATCKPKREDCPPFDTNVLNGQWKCSLDNQPVPRNTFPDSVECIFSCQSKDNPTSIVIVCDNGQWKVLQSYGDDSLILFDYFIQLGSPLFGPIKCERSERLH